MNDITERKQAEAALRESRELLKVVLDTIPLRVFWKDRDHKYLGCNLPYARDAGLKSIDELLGKDDTEMGWTEHAAEHRAKERQVMESGLPHMGHELCLRGPGDQVVWLLTNRTPLRDETGAVTGVLSTYEDISERKQTEQTLRESEERFRLAFVTSPDAININRLEDGVYIAVNQGFIDITGYTHADVKGTSSLELSIWVDPADRRRLVEALREDGSCANLEAQFRTKDGRIITGLMSATVMVLAGEKCILSVTRDITDRKEMETSLQERLAELDRFNKAMVNREVRMVELKKEINALLTAAGKPERHIPVGFLAAPETSRGDRLEAIEAGAEEFLAKPFDDMELVAQIQAMDKIKRANLQERDETRRLMAHVQERTDEVERSRIAALNLLEDLKAEIDARQETEGALRRLEWMLRPHYDTARDGTEAGDGWLTAHGTLGALNTLRVITDGVGPRELTALGGECLELLHTSVGVYEANGDYACAMTSPGWCRFLVESSRALCGLESTRDALACGRWVCHESCWGKAARRAVETGGAVDIPCLGGIRTYAIPIVTDAGIIGALTLGYGDPPRDAATLAELSVRYGVSIDDVRLQSSAYESRPPFVIELAKRRLRNAALRIASIVTSKQVKGERDRLEAHLNQIQRMESVGRLAGGVAHDFNNLVTGIMSYVAVCRDHLEAEHPVHAYLDEITSDAQRSADLTRQLLAFARKQTIAPKVLDLNSCVESMLKLLQRLIGEDIDLVWRPGANLGTCKLDASQVDQILANLCVNARDAIGGVGQIIIETHSASLDEEYCAGRAEAIPGRYVLLTVTDDGCGMDPETLGKAFEPFFTTKDIGEGTGLGLATVYGIVKQNNAFVDVYSELGVGTTFKIYLPCCSEDALAAPATPALPGLRGGTETVLLVEDEKSIRVTSRLFLQNLGYKVLTAECPRQALELVAQHDGPIHLLVTDVVMPGMNGRELAEKLAALYPDMKRIFMSGYTSNVIVHRGILDDGVDFLPKPFTRETLTRLVRSVLDRPA